MVNSTGAYIVSWDFSRGDDVGVLIVGRQNGRNIDIVNAFQGEEAHELYKKLTDKKGVTE